MCVCVFVCDADARMRNRACLSRVRVKLIGITAFLYVCAWHMRVVWYTWTLYAYWLLGAIRRTAGLGSVFGVRCCRCVPQNKHIYLFRMCIARRDV